jgi:molybdopterin-biosynthesis enzyme MoeA-like protein
LGPTADDITRDVVARVLSLSLAEDAALLETFARDSNGAA